MNNQQQKRNRAGQVLLEFALIASLLLMLLAMIFDFGRAIYSAQVVEQAADHIARELAVTPLAADFDFDPSSKKKLGDPDVNTAIAGIYSEDYLIMDISDRSPGEDLLAFLDTKYGTVPTGNRLLIPLMIQMDSTQNAVIPDGKRWLVYPGAIVPTTTAAPTAFTVRIPTVQYGTGGTETISDPNDWLHVVEVDAAMFKLSGSQRGVASVRVNYPFQAVAISGTTAVKDEPKLPIEVQDEPLLQKGLGPYSGEHGLGQQAAFTKTVRPFRRIVSGQGVYRREVFQ